jgi:ribosomal RNA-processing protein 8
VHSFDLVAVNDSVTQCDMKHVPLNNTSVDIAVFCLSLMGTNAVEFLCEAHRVLRQKGLLKIAEVVSRINNKDLFIRSVEAIGFKLVKQVEFQSQSYFFCCNTSSFF